MADWRDLMGVQLQGAKPADTSIVAPHVQKQGWKDQMSLGKIARGLIANHIGQTLGQHLHTDPEQQRQHANAIAGMLLK